jgi:hypothetical protein
LLEFRWHRNEHAVYKFFGLTESVRAKTKGQKAAKPPGLTEGRGPLPSRKKAVPNDPFMGPAQPFGLAMRVPLWKGALVGEEPSPGGREREVDREGLEPSRALARQPGPDNPVYRPEQTWPGLLQGHTPAHV